MRVLACGGRNYDDTDRIKIVMQEIHEQHNITVVIHGAARGADRLVSQWDKAKNIAQIACPAAWDVYGKAAGMIRNKYMLDVHKPELVVAFPGGRGTANMVNFAKNAGIEVLNLGRKESEEKAE